MKVETPEQFVKAYNKHGSINAVWHKEGMSSYTVARGLYVKAVKQGLMDPLPLGRKPVNMTRVDTTPKSPQPSAPKDKGGRIRALPTKNFELPPKGEIRRYFFGCAQNNTRLPQAMWHNLLALAEHYNAEVHIARFTYVKSGLGASGDKARVTQKQELYGGIDMWWDPDLIPYLSDERVEVAPGLVWCAEMNILPTASNPLSGLEVYTGRKSGIFPHVKIAMQSVPSGKNEPVKFNYTTGTVTMRNYIQKKAGLKAEFHHCYGALLVEVDHEGSWWCRQLNADSSGTIYDMNVRARAGKVTVGHRVDSIYWSDIHIVEANKNHVELAFGKGGMKDQLRPKAEFMGDIISFKARSHHEMKDPHTMYMRHVQGIDDAKVEVKMAGDFIRGLVRSWCRTYAVNGNHERHLGRWLKEHDGRKDPLNVMFWLDMQKLVYEYILAGGVEPNFLDLALSIVDAGSRKGIKFLDEDESVIRCEDAHGGIECGSHGDRGPRGARGSARGFAKMGRKRNIGDKHGAMIMDGVYIAGTFSVDDPDWTRGPSDWTCSQIVTYPNGKRAIVTFWDGKFRAE